MKIKIFYNYLFHVQKQINLLKKYIDTNILINLPEDFFKTIFGLKEEFIFEEKREILINTIIFLIYFKIVNGSDISFELKNNVLTIKNTDISYNLYLEDIKELILNEELSTVYFYDIPIVILTCNRVEQLKQCIKEYKKNFEIFSHNKVEIFISDDSNQENSLKNKSLENIFNIKVITPKEKTLFIDQKFNKFKVDYAYDIFGGHNVKSSYGKNRNFVSLYFYNKSFISLDDDSLPYTLTIKPEIIYNEIKNLDYISENKLKEFRFDDNQTILIPVDFYTYYKFFGKELMFSQYSGNKDMETYYILLKQMNFNLKEIGVTNKQRLEPDYFVYGRKLNRGTGIHTLCTYFPKDFKNRFTISSNYRIEDLIIGVNYYIEKGIEPLETAFSIFHNREEIINFNNLFIKEQILTKEAYPKYIEILNLIGRNNFFEKFSFYVDNNFINIEKNRIIHTKGYILHLYNIFSNALSISSKENKDIDSLYNGLNMIYSLSLNLLEKFNVKPFDSKGQEFDHNLHEAVMMEEKEDLKFDYVVLEELEKGYKFGNDVLRHARVKVGKKKKNNEEK